MFKLTLMGTSAAVLPALLLVPTSVATPVYSVDTGSITYISSPSNPTPETLVNFSFAGPSITISGEGEGGTSLAFALPFSGGLSLPLALGFEAGGVATINGTGYSVLFGSASSASVTTLADFTLTSTSLVASVPALVTGDLAVCLTLSQNCLTPFVDDFDVSFNVPGILTVTAAPSGEPGANNVVQFTPIPEPASLPLAGAGLATIAMLRRHRRRGPTSPRVSAHSAG